MITYQEASARCRSGGVVYGTDGNSYVIHAVRAGGAIPGAGVADVVPYKPTREVPLDDLFASFDDVPKDLDRDAIAHMKAAAADPGSFSWRLERVVGWLRAGCLKITESDLRILAEKTLLDLKFKLFIHREKGHSQNVGWYEECIRNAKEAQKRFLPRDDRAS